MSQIKSNTTDQKKRILLTGGRGFIGSRLTKALRSRGHEVKLLSRSHSAETYHWDIDNNEIEVKCVEGVDVIIHLAGASVAEGRWTKRRKEVLRSSRVKSSRLLYRALLETGSSVERFISASGTGYYGQSDGEAFVETDPPGSGFLSQLCVEWEQSARAFKELGAQTIVNRIGIVMDKEGGFMQRLESLVKRGLGSILGSGDQIMPWIHLDDLVNIFIGQVEGTLSRPVYNAVSPERTTHEQVMRSYASRYNKSIWLPKVPKFVLQLVLGELSKELTESQETSPRNLLEDGFEFEYSTIEKVMNTK